jgi:hypothetical protein
MKRGRGKNGRDERSSGIEILIVKQGQEAKTSHSMIAVGHRFLLDFGITSSITSVAMQVCIADL